MSATPPTLGDRLKAERERREFSAQKAADQLHLDAWVIDALEAEDYQRIGPSVYAKGHLKRYATLLGLPAAEILAAYEARVQGPRPESPPPPANVRLTASPPAVSNLPWAPIVGCAAAVLLLLGILWWKPWQQRGAALDPQASAPNLAGNLAGDPGTVPADNSADLAADAPPAEQPGAAAQPMASAPPLASAPASTPPAAIPLPDTAAGTGRARLRMSFSADSWVDVHDSAGHLAFAGNGRANSVKTISGAAPLRVYLRSVSGVQLEINDRAVAIGPQFVNGDVARFEAGADGVLRRDSHPATVPGAVIPGAATPAVQSRNVR
jgi:cytoskeleton protein RodZ